MLKNVKKILVISAHADDMELGCGASVHKWGREGIEIFNLILSLNQKGLAEGFSREVIIEEAMVSANILGIPEKNVFIENFENRIFPEKRQVILDCLWDYRRKLNPDLIITGSLDDMHQDHITVAQESFRAFKEHNIISYGFDWNRINKQVNYYSVISEEDLRKKIAAVMSYKSQHNGRRNYFCEEFIRAWAITRGVEIKAPFAEAFSIIKFISTPIL